MTLDRLLIWLSARERGSWHQFRAAVEELHSSSPLYESNSQVASTTTFPGHQAVRLDLERLGHVEFSSSAGGLSWRVVPPAIAIRETHNRAIGILCGARDPDLTSRLDALPRGFAWDSLEADGMPRRLRVIAGNTKAMERVGGLLRVRIQCKASESILAAVPPIDDPRNRIRALEPTTPGWTIDRFSVSSLRWTAGHAQKDREIGIQDFAHTANGMFRFRREHQRLHFLRWRSVTYRLPGQVGKYLALRSRRRRNILRYDRERSLLSVPAICRPPLLIERALVLCSGCLPSYDTRARLLSYSVPWTIALLAATLLRQRII